MRLRPTRHWSRPISVATLADQLLSAPSRWTDRMGAEGTGRRQLMTERTIRDPWHHQTVTFVTRSRESAGELLRAEVELAPGGTVPRHVHLRQDERVRVVEGSLVIRVGGRDRVVNAGDTADVPRRKLHMVRNAGPVNARFVLEVRPARRMESAMRGLFFVLRRLAWLGRRGA